MKSFQVHLVGMDAQGNALRERRCDGLDRDELLAQCNETFGGLVECNRIVAKLEEMVGEPTCLELTRVEESPRIWRIEVQSLRLEPDYGGASLWEYSGACSMFAENDILPGRERMADTLVERIEYWQSHFETRVDDEPSSPSSLPFEWSSFQSHGAALCLASMSILRLPLHLGSPWELRSESGDRADDDWWFPSWGAQNNLEGKACLALSALDEQRFIELLGQGASQDPRASMPWSVFCAHMGLAKAFEQCLATQAAPRDRVCKWGCDPLDAAVFAYDGECARIALANGFRGSGWPTSPVERLIDGAALVGPEQAKRMVSELAMAGASLDVSRLLVGRLRSEQSQALAWVEKADLERSAMLSLGTDASSRSGPARI